MKGKDIINSFCIPFTQHNSEEGKKLNFLMDEKGGIIVKIGFLLCFIHVKIEKFVGFEQLSHLEMFRKGRSRETSHFSVLRFRSKVLLR